MISKTEWDAALAACMAVERAKLGPSPTADELVGYIRGTLSEDDTRRVRAAVVYDPDLDGLFDEPDDRGVPLSDIQVAHDWVALQARVRAQSQPRRESSRMLLAAAALIAVMITALIAPRLLERDSSGESVRVELRPTARRGPAGIEPYVVPHGAEQYVLVPMLVGEAQYESYRVHIVPDDPAQSTWESPSLRRLDDGTVPVTVDGHELREGGSTVEVYGLDAGEPHLVERYAIFVQRATR